MNTTKADAFIKELKALLKKYDVILSPAEQDATDEYPAEFRSGDDGKTIFIEINKDLKERLLRHGD